MIREGVQKRRGEYGLLPYLDQEYLNIRIYSSDSGGSPGVVNKPYCFLGFLKRVKNGLKWLKNGQKVFSLQNFI